MRRDNVAGGHKKKAFAASIQGQLISNESLAMCRRALNTLRKPWMSFEQVGRATFEQGMACCDLLGSFGTAWPAAWDQRQGPAAFDSRGGTAGSHKGRTCSRRHMAPESRLGRLPSCPEGSQGHHKAC